MQVLRLSGSLCNLHLIGFLRLVLSVAIDQDELQLYLVSAVTQGTDSLGEVAVRLVTNARVFCH